MTTPARDHAYWFGLIGYPLEHSLSPRLHTAALRDAGLTGRYDLFPVDPQDSCEERLRGLVEDLRARRLDGLNVTIPHKQNVMEFVEVLSPVARSVGAVNTLYERGGYIHGENTDVGGFTHALQRLWNLPPGRALVLGAGGSARAVAYALSREGWQVVVFARRAAQSAELAEGLNRLPDCAGRLASGKLDPLTMSGQSADLVVNTTPLGMYPKVDASPWPDDMPLPSGAVVYDLVYNPLGTQFVRRAKAQGLRAASGMSMLAAQAALAFGLWTGLEPPFSVMEKAGLALRTEGGE